MHTPTIHQPTRDDVAEIFYGVAVLDFEDGVVALTHDRRRAIAALNALYRLTDHSSLAQRLDGLPLHLGQDWLRLEHRDDGPWYFPTSPDHPHALPATTHTH